MTTCFYHHHVCKDLMCLIAVGGLTSPVKGPYTEPLNIANKPPDSLQLLNSSVNYEDGEEHEESVEKVISAGRRLEELDDDEDEEKEAQRDSSFCPQKLIFEPNYKKGNKVTTLPELELRKLERGDVSLSVVLILSFVKRMNSADCFPCLFADFYLSSLSQLHSAEMQEQLLFPYSPWEPWDKKVTQKSQCRVSLIYFTLCRRQTVGGRLINGK